MKAMFWKVLRFLGLDVLLLGLLDRLAANLVKKFTAFQNAVQSKLERLLTERDD